MTAERHFGITGLATVGANLARNVAHHDIPVAVHNRTTSRTDAFIEEHGSEGPLTGHVTVEDPVGSLARPHVLMSMVQAGTATDAVIDEIVPHLDAGDVLIEISARVLAKTDEATGKPLIDVILDAADEVQV